ncbi:hypothetical protein [Clostridium sp. HBUAS56017]|uniref:hypothetical protein n=1 Tax=Clostridium sp. HBUAS56017 TaxID=2571128 RepID=UPI0011787991|nr:hypothetical protein [Clostridium sp. HBUAS56017]
MKSNLKKNLFYIIIFLIILICIISSLILRSSIIKYDYNRFLSERNQYLYHPYKDLKSSSGVFSDITNENYIDMNNFSDYIVKGVSTGEHEILEGAVLTQIRITKVIKGNIDKETIYIYEPISVKMAKNSFRFLSSILGYNFIKDGQEYLFCINDFSNIKQHVYTEKEKNSYIYKSPLLAKFPMKYNDSDFKIINEDEFNKNNNYNEYNSYEQIFSSEKNKELYFKCREQLMQMID